MSSSTLLPSALLKLLKLTTAVVAFQNKINSWNSPEQYKDITELDLQTLLLAEEQNKLDMKIAISQTDKTQLNVVLT